MEEKSVLHKEMEKTKVLKKRDSIRIEERKNLTISDPKKKTSFTIEEEQEEEQLPKEEKKEKEVLLDDEYVLRQREIEFSTEMYQRKKKMESLHFLKGLEDSGDDTSKKIEDERLMSELIEREQQLKRQMEELKRQQEEVLLEQLKLEEKTRRYNTLWTIGISVTSIICTVTFL